MTQQVRGSRPNKIIDWAQREKLNDKERRQLQHEFKIYMEQYFKRKLGKGVDYTQINICEDFLVIRGEGFLTDPEKYIVETPSGNDIVKAARMQVIKQHIIDNMPYFEERLGAKAVHQCYNMEPENDFWMHTIIFDRQLTEKKPD